VTRSLVLPLCEERAQHNILEPIRKRYDFYSCRRAVFHSLPRLLQPWHVVNASHIAVGIGCGASKRRMFVYHNQPDSCQPSPLHDTAQPVDVDMMPLLHWVFSPPQGHPSEAEPVPYEHQEGPSQERFQRGPLGRPEDTGELEFRFPWSSLLPRLFRAY